MQSMFQNCYVLQNLDVSNFVTSNVVTMYRMFYGCKIITTLEITNFDTSNVIDMAGMFHDCQNLKNMDSSINGRISWACFRTL